MSDKHLHPNPLYTHYKIETCLIPWPRATNSSRQPSTPRRVPSSRSASRAGCTGRRSGGTWRDSYWARADSRDATKRPMWTRRKLWPSRLSISRIWRNPRPSRRYVPLINILADNLDQNPQNSQAPPHCRLRPCLLGLRKRLHPPRTLQQPYP